MTRGIPSPHMTERRAEWMRAVERGHTDITRKAYECIALGWAEWVRDKAGRATDVSALTAVGRAMLAEWDRKPPAEVEYASWLKAAQQDGSPR